jgi:hypothetical protein
MGYWDLNSPPVRLPDRRILRAFAFDPMSTRLSGRYLPVSIRFEPDLEPGPAGELVQVVDYDASRDAWYRPVDLDDPAVLAQNGLQPSESDPRSHQQVVYAVTMSVIERVERFLGRRFRWRGDDKLRLVPHAFEGRNAYFDPARGAVLFGYYRALPRDTEANVPNQLMFTCLSVDVVAHEVTHAILNRIRRHYSLASNPDVYAWHEAIADLVALFHHFAFPEVISEAVASSRGDLENADALFDLAREFGTSTGRGKALRSAIGSEPDPAKFTSTHEPHDRGAIFVAAVFDAYLDTYRSQIADLRRMSTGGTGILPKGAIAPDLVKRVTIEAVKQADRILGMVVRALDYLPVVDVTFGDVVRAIITADRALFPDDEAHLRATLVESLRKRGIYPVGVSSLADEALVWTRPVIDLDLTIGAGGTSRGGVTLSSVMLAAAMRLDAGGKPPAQDNDPAVFRQLNTWCRQHAYELGFDPDLSLHVDSLHVAYLTAADGQPRPIIVAQIIQRHEELEIGDDRDRRVRMYAGTTIVARPDGRVLQVIAKPLPLTNPKAIDTAEESRRNYARSFHEAGLERYAKLMEWFGVVDSADALAVWSPQPAVARLTFAQLHSDETETP